LLLVILGGLYVFSGLPLPRPRPTQSAYDKASFGRCRSLASVIQYVGQDATTAQIKRALEDAEISFNGNEGLYGGEKVILLEKPGLYEIVVVGQRRDQNGMVWAVTRGGDVLKILPSVDYTQREVP